MTAAGTVSLPAEKVWSASSAGCAAACDCQRHVIPRSANNDVLTAQADASFTRAVACLRADRVSRRLGAPTDDDHGWVQVTAVDTNGAGDTFATAYMLALASRSSRPGAVANWAAAQAVSQPQARSICLQHLPAAAGIVLQDAGV